MNTHEARRLMRRLAQKYAREHQLPKDERAMLLRMGDVYVRGLVQGNRLARDGQGKT